jgi:hypothetical protein
VTRAEREARVLRDLACAIEDAERARQWLEGPGPKDEYGVRVEWTWGASVAGHKELCNEVRRGMEHNMPALLAEAFARLANRVNLARESLNKLRGE